MIEYFLRCPFSQARMIEVTAQGQVIYKTGDIRLGGFPKAASQDLLTGPKGNFQVFDPLDFLAEVTQNIPDPGEHLIGYYGFYSNKSRGLRTQGQAQAAPAAAPNSASAPSAKQAMSPVRAICPVVRGQSMLAERFSQFAGITW